MVSAAELNDMIKGMLLKDLRVQLRARRLNPAGSREALLERLSEAMLANGDFKMYAEGTTVDDITSQAATENLGHSTGAQTGNNYHRAEGQNVGNFLTERNSSRVLAPPGGASQICFGDYVEPAKAKVAAPEERSGTEDIGNAASGNNYHRPSGQNVGNFLTDRNSSRVLAPPGGASQISFG